MLPDRAEIVAWEAEGEGVELWNLSEVESSDICREDRLLGGARDVLPIGLCRVRMIFNGPTMADR